MAINTIKHLSYILRVRPYKLEELIKNVDRYYYQKEVVKIKDGSPRIKNGVVQVRKLDNTFGLLKEVQKSIDRKILKEIALPDFAFGCVKGKDNVMHAVQHKSQKYILQTDLVLFFPSITNRMVFGMFRTHGFSSTVSRILTRVTTVKGYVPLGPPTSPSIANLVFAKTGFKLQQFASAHNLKFTTYVDDIVFSSQEDFRHVIPFLFSAIQADGFRISYSKTNYAPIQDITGVKVFNNKLDLTDKLKLKFLDSSLSSRQLVGLRNYREKVLAAN